MEESKTVIKERKAKTHMKGRNQIKMSKTRDETVANLEQRLMRNNSSLLDLS
jgi:hypothetical protein